ncbi:radical SAM protein [Kitasatospora sp. NPDC001527]|uniref:radical SAM/SPASM domain-containing protein n=1 Tax=Kitasatospora sp. NPDC001527 TaxID=3154519 RepID=UPI0033341333
MARKLSRYHFASPPVFDELSGRTRRVVFATRSAELRVLDEAAWQLLTAEPERLPGDVVEDLTGIHLLVDDGEDELRSVVDENRDAIDALDCLSLVVTPTAQCQLGCGYCGQEHSARWLSPHHQDAFVRQVARKLDASPYREVDLCWFGAEPLVGMTVIRELTPRLRALAEERGCSFGARIITNGLALGKRIARELVERHGVASIDITLDGTPEYHDARRGTKSGSPTFRRIFANLVALAESDLAVRINLRINVDESNWQGVSPLIDMLARTGLQRRVACYFAPIHSWGNDAHKKALSARQFADLEVQWHAELVLAGFPGRLVPGRRRIVCLAVQKDGVLVDANGTLFHCTEAPYVPGYGEPDAMAIGTVDAGEDPERRTTLSLFNDEVRAGAYNCSSCALLPVCGGACPKLWKEGIPPCPSTLLNMPERLLLVLASHRINAERTTPTGAGTTTATTAS